MRLRGHTGSSLLAAAISFVVAAWAPALAQQDVAKLSAAENVGLRPGDVVVKPNEKPIADTTNPRANLCPLIPGINTGRSVVGIPEEQPPLIIGQSGEPLPIGGAELKEVRQRTPLQQELAERRMARDLAEMFPGSVPGVTFDDSGALVEVRFRHPCALVDVGKAAATTADRTKTPKQLGPIERRPVGSEQPAEREPIGEVFGRPVYRDEIRKEFEPRFEIHRLFIEPITERYKKAHSDGVELTEEEIQAALRYKSEQARSQGGRAAEAWQRITEGERTDASKRLDEIDRKPATTDLSDEDRRQFQSQRAELERMLAQPGSESFTAIGLGGEILGRLSKPARRAR